MIFYKLKSLLTTNVPSVLIGNSVLGRVHETRYVIFTLYRHLKFGPHIHSVDKNLAVYDPMIYRAENFSVSSALK